METLSFSEIDEVSGAGFAKTVSTTGTISGFAAIGFSVGGPIGGVAGQCSAPVFATVTLTAYSKS